MVEICLRSVGAERMFGCKNRQQDEANKAGAKNYQLGQTVSGRGIGKLPHFYFGIQVPGRGQAPPGPRLLNILFPHFFEHVVCRSPAESHDGQRGVLMRSRRERRPIDYKKVLHIPGLVEPIED